MTTLVSHHNPEHGASYSQNLNEGCAFAHTSRESVDPGVLVSARLGMEKGSQVVPHIFGVLTRTLRHKQAENE